jgi:hypothetical protein
LFEDKSLYRYPASNRPNEDAAVTMEWYTQRGDASDNRIKDMKVGVGTEYMPCGFVPGQRGLLRHRGADPQSVSRLSLRYARKRMERSQVQTVRWRLFQTAGKIVRHGRQIFLQIGAAMLDIFAAIGDRCARIMREGGAIPETS